MDKDVLCFEISALDPVGTFWTSSENGDLLVFLDTAELHICIMDGESLLQVYIVHAAYPILLGLKFLTLHSLSEVVKEGVLCAGNTRMPFLRRN